MWASDVAFGMTALLVWAAAVYKVIRLKPAGARPAGRNLATYALVGCLIAGAAAVTVQVSVIGGPIDRIAEFDLSQIVAAVLVIAGTCAFQVFVVCVNDPHLSAWRRVRPRLLTAVVAIAATAMLFILSQTTQSEVWPVGDDPYGAAHVVAYAAYMCIGAIDVSHQAMRFARLGDRSLLRLGLYMVSGGAYIVGIFAGMKIAFVVLLAVFGPDLMTAERAVTYPLIVTGAVLTSVGSTIPSWGRWVGAERPARWLGLYMSHLTLYPLWRALVDAAVTVPLDQRSRWADRLVPTDIRFRLIRRIIEIRDGLVSLRPYRDPSNRRIAHVLAVRSGLSSVDLAATVEAADIAGALEAHAAGHQPQHDPGPDGRVDESTVDLAATVADEVSWLSRVTDALQHSPIVAARHRYAAGQPLALDTPDPASADPVWARETP